MITANDSPFLLHEGQTYQNGRGDFRGPMEQRAPNVWLDQYGILYHSDGRCWDHIEGSTANLDLATAGTTEGWRDEAAYARAAQWEADRG